MLEGAEFMNVLMKFDPATGDEKPYPSDASQYRAYHGLMAWLYNPWSGKKRNPADIGSDTFGKLICEMEVMPELVHPPCIGDTCESVRNVNNLMRENGSTEEEIFFAVIEAVASGPDGIGSLEAAVKERLGENS